MESAHKVEDTTNDSQRFDFNVTRGAQGQTVVVVDLRRIVFWGLEGG